MKSKRLKFFLITIIFCIIVSIVMVEKFKSTNEKKLKKYAITETSHFISNLIQQIVDDVSNNKLDDNKIFSISRNNYNEIEIIDFNTKEVNNVLEEITTKIEENLKIIQGKIPNYYNGEFESNSTTYSLPLKK